LHENHEIESSVWLIFRKKGTPNPNLSWSESVDEALCYGWIDSVKRPIDKEKYIQFFSKRKNNSTWSKINKDKVELLIANGQMTAAGLRCIEIAKENGSWTYLDTVDALIVPKDLEEALAKFDGAKAHYESLSKSEKKLLLYRVHSAKRPETRQKRILEIAKNASENHAPNAS